MRRKVVSSGFKFSVAAVVGTRNLEKVYAPIVWTGFRLCSFVWFVLFCCVCLASSNMFSSTIYKLRSMGNCDCAWECNFVRIFCLSCLQRQVQCLADSVCLVAWAYQESAFLRSGKCVNPYVMFIAAIVFLGNRNPFMSYVTSSGKTNIFLELW